MPGFRQQPPREVEVARARRRDEHRVGGGEVAVIAHPSPARAAIDDAHQPLAVDRGRQGAADAQVVEGRARVLRQDDHRLVAGGGGHDVGLRLALHLAHEARVDVDQRIELPRPVAGECRFALALAVHHLQPVEIGEALAPVVLEAFEGHPPLRVAAGDAEGSGADALEADAVDVRIRRHHHAIIFGQHEGELGIAGIEVEADRRRVHHLGALDLRGREVAAAVQFEGGRDIRGRDDAAVVKADALADRRLPDFQRLVRRLDAAGKLQLEPQVLVHPGQRVVGGAGDEIDHEIGMAGVGRIAAAAVAGQLGVDQASAAARRGRRLRRCQRRVEGTKDGGARTKGSATGQSEHGRLHRLLLWPKV